jgi:hypothetical protein
MATIMVQPGPTLLIQPQFAGPSETPSSSHELSLCHTLCMAAPAAAAATTDRREQTCAKCLPPDRLRLKNFAREALPASVMLMTRACKLDALENPSIHVTAHFAQFHKLFEWQRQQRLFNVYSVRLIFMRYVDLIKLFRGKTSRRLMWG